MGLGGTGVSDFFNINSDLNFFFGGGGGGGWGTGEGGARVNEFVLQRIQILKIIEGGGGN